MPRFDTYDMDPHVQAELDAIDATLAGDPVDPAYAELAELALLLADGAPRPEAAFARDLDRRVARRFEPAPVDAGASRPASRSRTSRRLPRWAAGPAAALVAAAVAVAVITSGGLGGHAGTTPSPTELSLNAAANPAHGSGARSKAGTGAGSSVRSGADAGAGVRAPLGPDGGAGSGVYTVPQTLLTAPGAASGGGGRQIASASIALSTANRHVSQVAQEVFNVVSAQHGSVSNSQVTAATAAGGGGYASFTLSIPTANLQAAMTQLSRLRFAAVASRTDGTQNVANQYNGDQRRLTQAQALRTSLLKQLQAATSQTAIDSIEAQLKTANAQIASAQSALASLRHRLSYSNVSVQVNQGGAPIVTPLRGAHSGGLTLARAGHDALRVLVVSAGVALIALAVLVPLGLLAALLTWLGLTLRQRRRERALDAS